MARHPRGARSTQAIARERFRLVQRWLLLCRDNPDIPRVTLAERVVESATINCSVRSLQMWARRERTIDGS